MKRRSKAGTTPARPRHGRAAVLRRRNPPKPASDRTPSDGGRKAAIAPSADETLEQLSATSEVLKIIGASRGRLEPASQAKPYLSARRGCGGEVRYGLRRGRDQSWRRSASRFDPDGHPIAGNGRIRGTRPIKADPVLIGASLTSIFFYGRCLYDASLMR
jgi:hypothetical protein